MRAARNSIVARSAGGISSKTDRYFQGPMPVRQDLLRDRYAGTLGLARSFAGEPPRAWCGLCHPMSEVGASACKSPATRAELPATRTRRPERRAVSAQRCPMNLYAPPHICRDRFRRSAGRFCGRRQVAWDGSHPDYRSRSAEIDIVVVIQPAWSKTDRGDGQ